MNDGQDYSNFGVMSSQNSSLPPSSPDMMAPKSRSAAFPALIIVMIIICIGAAIMFIPGLLKENDEENNNVRDDEESAYLDEDEVFSECPQTTVAYEDLTKEDVVDWLETVRDDSNCAIQKLLGSNEISLDDSHLTLLYSYSDPSEIQKIANESVMNANRRDGTKINFKIDQKDHYAVVYDEEGEGCSDFSGYCYTGITFDKAYVNYYSETVTSPSGSSMRNDRTIFVNTNKEWLKKALDIIQATSSYLKTTYETSLEFDGGKYIYRTKNVTVGIDMDRYEEFVKTKQIPYAINFYTTESTIDPQTGIKTSVRNSSGDGVMEVTRRIQISADEAMSMMISE